MDNTELESTEEIVQQDNSKKLITIVVVTIAVAVIATIAIILLTPKTNPGPSDAANSTTQNTSNEAFAGVALITFTDEGFSPTTLTVKKGTVVTVDNKSTKPVQFSSDDHPTHTHNTEMNMKELAQGESGTFTAETVGTHGFHDHIDDSKTGTITVTE